MEPILFLDFPSREIGAWNPQTWKTRYTLNIKAIPYKTIWVDYPDVEAACKKLGAAPTGVRSDGAPLYTLPAIFDPNTQTAVSDSGAIARYLDRTYPVLGPPLVPAELDALHRAFDAAFVHATFGTGHFAALVVPAACAALRPRGAAHFRRAREGKYGPLEALAPVGSEARAVHLRGAREAFGAVAGWLGRGADGGERLLFGGAGAGAGVGEGICFADVTVAAFLKWLRKLLPAEEWAEVMAWDGGRWARFVEVFAPYEAEDAGSDVEL